MHGTGRWKSARASDAHPLIRVRTTSDEARSTGHAPHGRPRAGATRSQRMTMSMCCRHSWVGGATEGFTARTGDKGLTHQGRHVRPASPDTTVDPRGATRRWTQVRGTRDKSPATTMTVVRHGKMTQARIAHVAQRQEIGVCWMQLTTSWPCRPTERGATPVRITVDSCAAEVLFPPTLAAGYATKPSARLKAGAKKVSMRAEDGEARVTTFQVVNVTKPLDSAGRIPCRGQNRVG